MSKPLDVLAPRRSLVALVLLVVTAGIPTGVNARAATTAEDLAALFDRYGDSGVGWTGGDGAYSVTLPDGRTAWLFSDTFLGPVNADGRSRPHGAPFIHNSIVVQDGDLLDTIYDDTDGYPPRAAINPPEPGGFYWLGDATVEDGALKVFALRFVAAPIPFGFQQVGTDVATLSLEDFSVTSIEHLPLGFIPGEGGAPVTYGMGLMEHGAYTYVYGVEDLHIEKFLHVARAPAGDVEGPWEFWTGSTWSDNPLLSARLLSGISNEMSVHRDGDEYVLVAQGAGAGPDVVTSRAPAPTGPWEPVRAIFRAPEAGNRSMFTYNAKAHPQLSDEDSVVVTYNVNTTNSADLYADIDIYRPRFVQLSLN